MNEIAHFEVHTTPLTCVLFDLYGTLVDLQLNEDSPALWRELTEALRTWGGTVGGPGDTRERFRGILRDEATRGEEGFLMEPTFRRLLLSVGAREEMALLGRRFRELSTEQLSVRPYVVPLFDELRRASCKIGIVSNTEAVLTRLDLERCPVLLSADTIVLSSEAGVRKPDPRIFQVALTRLGATAASAVFVGNSLADDVVGARRAGLRAIYLDHSASGVEPLPDCAGTVLRARPTRDSLTRALQSLGCPRPPD